MKDQSVPPQLAVLQIRASSELSGVHQWSRLDPPQWHCCIEPSLDPATANLPGSGVTTRREEARSGHPSAARRPRAGRFLIRAEEFAVCRSQDRSMQQCRSEAVFGEIRRPPLTSLEGNVRTVSANGYVRFRLMLDIWVPVP